MIQHSCQQKNCSQKSSKESDVKIEVNFFCLPERMFLCQECYNKHHRGHQGAESVKNHLSRHLQKWQELQKKALEQKITLNENIKNQRYLLQNLIQISDNKVEINPLKLPRILDILRKTLFGKIKQVFKHCKENNLIALIDMNPEYKRIANQLQEIIFRSTPTQLIAQFLPKHPDTELTLVKDMPINKQLFLLRKQYDAKSQKLMEVAKKQRGIIESIQDEIYKLELRLESPDTNDEQGVLSQDSKRTVTNMHSNLIKSHSHDVKRYSGQESKGQVSKFESNQSGRDGSTKMLIQGEMEEQDLEQLEYQLNQIVVSSGRNMKSQQTYPNAQLQKSTFSKIKISAERLPEETKSVSRLSSDLERQVQELNVEDQQSPSWEQNTLAKKEQKTSPSDHSAGQQK